MLNTGTIFKPHFLKMAKMQIALCCTKSLIYSVLFIHSGNEGRCGMAATVLSCDHTDIDWRKFYTHVTTYLPVYACPKFLRIRESIAVTSTFKQLKGDLVKEGFNPGDIGDVLYVMDAVKKTYGRLDAAVYQDILDGKYKL